MKLKFTKTDPMGNTTVFIWSAVPRDKQPSIACQIMNSDYLRAEQVAFAEKPTQAECIARLQMMGGELSVNATLAFAAVLSKRESVSDFTIEVSGCNKPIECVVKNLERPCISLPLPSKNLVKAVRTQINGASVPAQIVNLIGITYFLVDENLYQNTGSDDRKKLKNLRDQFPNDVTEDAWGLVFCRDNCIKPIVYVRKTDTAVQEMACGSASLALALAKGCTEIIQPSGEIIKVDLRKNQAVIEGRVTIVAEGIIDVA